MRDAEASVAAMRGLDRARALAQQALILQRSGRLEDALTVYAAALPALLRHRDRLWEARLRNNRAILYAYRGHLRRAKADIARSEDLFAALKLPRAQAGARWNLGVIEGKRGDIPAALTALDSVAEVYRKVGVPMAPLLLDHGEILLSAGLADEALATVTAAVAELSQAGHAADLAEAQLLLARAQLSADAPGAASASTAAARAASRASTGPAGRRRPCRRSARHLGGRGTLPRLLRLARNAAQRLDAVGWSTAALDIRLLTARIATDLGLRPRHSAIGGRRAGAAVRAAGAAGASLRSPWPCCEYRPVTGAALRHRVRRTGRPPNGSGRSRRQRAPDPVAVQVAGSPRSAWPSPSRRASPSGSSLG